MTLSESEKTTLDAALADLRTALVTASEAAARVKRIVPGIGIDFFAVQRGDHYNPTPFDAWRERVENLLRGLGDSERATKWRAWRASIGE